MKKKIELSDLCRQRIIEEIDKSELYETAEYVGDYQDYHVYVLSFLKPEEAGCNGLPEYLLVKDPEVKRATIEQDREFDRLF